MALEDGMEGGQADPQADADEDAQHGSGAAEDGRRRGGRVDEVRCVERRGADVDFLAGRCAFHDAADILYRTLTP